MFLSYNANESLNQVLNSLTKSLQKLLNLDNLKKKNFLLRLKKETLLKYLNMLNHTRTFY